MDYNQDLSIGEYEKGIVNVVVEIPAGGIEKIEWDRSVKSMRVERVDPIDFPTPINYGFIPRTINFDNDNLDVLVVSDSAIPTGTVLSSKIIGIMKFDDEGVSDDKIIVVPINSDYGDDSIHFITDLPSRKIDEIMYFFSHYKDHLNVSPTDVKGWGNIAEAKQIIALTSERWNNQQTK